MIPEYLDQSSFFLLILWSFIIGFLLGAVYDIFRIRRIAFLPKQENETKAEPADKQKRAGNVKGKIDCLLIFLEDIFFFTFAAVLMVLLMYKLNGGRVRIFTLIPLVLGFFVYRITVGKLVIRCAEIIIGFIYKLVRRIISVTVTPVIRLIKKLYAFIHERVLEARRVRYTDRREKTLSDQFTLFVGKRADENNREGEKTDEIG